MIKKLLTEYNIPDLLWHYKGFLDEILPAKATDFMKPEVILAEIDRNKKAIDSFDNSSLEELIQKELLQFEKNKQNLISYMTVEDIKLKKQATSVISRIENWKPQYESSQYLKRKVIERIQDDIENYFAEYYNDFEWKAEKVKEYLINQQQRLKTRNEELENSYSASKDYYDKRQLFEGELESDLGLLKNR